MLFFLHGVNVRFQGGLRSEQTKSMEHGTFEDVLSIKNAVIEIAMQVHEKDLPSVKLTAKALENRPSQNKSSLPTDNFQGRVVSFRDGKPSSHG